MSRVKTALLCEESRNIYQMLKEKVKELKVGNKKEKGKKEVYHLVFSLANLNELLHSHKINLNLSLITIQSMFGVLSISLVD